MRGCYSPVCRGCSPCVWRQPYASEIAAPQIRAPWTGEHCSRRCSPSAHPPATACCSAPPPPVPQSSWRLSWRARTARDRRETRVSDMNTVCACTCACACACAECTCCTIPHIHVCAPVLCTPPAPPAGERAQSGRGLGKERVCVPMSVPADGATDGVTDGGRRARGARPVRVRCTSQWRGSIARLASCCCGARTCSSLATRRATTVASRPWKLAAPPFEPRRVTCIQDVRPHAHTHTHARARACMHAYSSWPHVQTPATNSACIRISGDPISENR